MSSPLAIANLAVKLVFLGFLVYPILRPDLPQFEGKAMAARAGFYWLAVAIVPAIWWLRGRPRPYPHAIDMLVVAPFLIDTAGNAFDAYAWKPFDDIAHFLNWALLVTAFALALARLPQLGRWTIWGLAVGFGASTHILWELAEWVVMKVGGAGGLQLTYEDTIGDLFLSFSGSVAGSTVAALLLVPLVWRRAAADRYGEARRPAAVDNGGNQ